MSAVPRSRSTDRRFYGVAEGLVEDNADPESEGRVKVTFPWFSGEMVSEWCRVAQFYAGPEFGAYFTPEIGAEVLVAFVHGDMRVPVVIGGLYNGQDKPPAARNGSDPKYIQTKAGHKIVFEDASGEERIEIIDSSGKNSIVIDTVANTITVTGESDVTVEAKTGSLTLKGAAGVSIMSDAGIDINAGGDVTVIGSTINLN
jgi:phage baseplate assembly protein V